jgi:hypothetical protein
MGTKDHHPLRDKLDTFSRRLDARVREFKDRGGLSETHEAFTEDIRKRQAFLGEKLDSAIRKGAPWDVIKYEFELGFNALMEDFEQLEKQLDAETMKRERTKRST